MDRDYRAGGSPRRGAASALADLGGGFWWLCSLLGDDPDARAPRRPCEPPPDARRLRMYLAGCVLFSLGVKLFIDAGLGVDPLHSMFIGIVRAVHLPLVGLGLVAAAVTAALLAQWSAWNRRLPPAATFLTMALVGFLIDLWNLVGLERWTVQLLSPAPMMLAGLLLDAYASALIIMSGIGLRVMDLVAIAAMRRYGCSFLAAKLALEGSFVATALVLGGPVGVGTVAFFLLVAPFIPSFVWVNGRVLHLPNHGLAARRPVPA